MDECWHRGIDKPIKTPKPGRFEIGEGTFQEAVEKNASTVVLNGLKSYRTVGLENCVA